MTQPQKILVFQQRGSGEPKIAGVRKYGHGLYAIEIVHIDEPLPPVLDDTQPYLPTVISADLVLDYLRHPDLSEDLARRCAALKIPVVASGKKVKVSGVYTPPTCCGLSRPGRLGLYEERFGAPEIEVQVDNGHIQKVMVRRGAPCGATWEAAEKMEGWPVEEAAVRYGLEVQYFCVADPSGWDPLYGKSPVHFAGHVHKKAMLRALKAVGVTPSVHENPDEVPLVGQNCV